MFQEHLFKSRGARLPAEPKETNRIERTGNRIKSGHSTARLRASYRPTDIDLFQATPETLRQDLNARPKDFEKRVEAKT